MLFQLLSARRDIVLVLFSLNSLQFIHCQCVGTTLLGVFLVLRDASLARILQVNFGTLDIRHLYDLHRWKFIRSISGV